MAAVSPDGIWRWNGKTWQSAAGPLDGQPPTSTGRRIAIAGGLVGIAILSAVLSVLVAKPLGWIVALGGAIGAYVAYRGERNRARPKATTWTGWYWAVGVLVLWYTQCGLLRN